MWHKFKKQPWLYTDANIHHGSSTDYRNSEIYPRKYEIATIETIIVYHDAWHGSSYLSQQCTAVVSKT